MKSTITEINNKWNKIRFAALVTVGKDSPIVEPNDDWKRRMLLSEHSPIRLLTVSWLWEKLPYWVSVHFVRHNIGITHFVKSQREDRNPDVDDRGEEPQDAPVNHFCEANAQSIINISRKRLCSCASEETRDAWMNFIYELEELEPALFEVLVPDCVYRGWCYEMKSCGYHLTDDFKRELHLYRSKINGWSE